MAISVLAGIRCGLLEVHDCHQSGGSVEWFGETFTGDLETDFSLSDASALQSFIP